MDQEAHVTTQLFPEQSVGTVVGVRQNRPRPESRFRAGIAGFVLTFQSVLFLAHGFVYWTWAAFQNTDPLTATMLKAALAVLSSTFITASLLAFRYYNALVRTFYRIAATWLGFFNFFFLAAALSWLVLVGVRLSRVPIGRPEIAGVLFSFAALAGLYGMVNARRVRVKEITVKLPDLPRSWR